MAWNPEFHQIVVRGVGPQWGRVWEFNELANNLDVSWQTDGGDKELSWSLDHQSPYDSVLPNPGALVDLYDEDYCIWSGIFVRFEGEPWTDGAGLTFACEGLGLRGSLQEHRNELILPKGLTFSNALIRAWAPLGGPIEITPGRLSPVLASINLEADTADFNGRTPADITKALLSYVSGLLPPFHWHVRSNREGGGPPYLDVYEYDTTPMYTVNLSDGIDLRTKTDLHRVINRVTVKWTKLLSGEDGQTPTVEEVTEVSSSSIETLGGIIIDKTIDASNDLFDPVSARGLAQRHLVEFADLRPTGGTMTLDYGTVIRDRSGKQIPPWQIYPGGVIQLGDITPTDAEYFNDRYPIVGVNWKESERQVILSLGELNTIDRQILHVVSKNQTALTRHSEGITGKVDNEQKGKPGGVAPLNQDGKVPPEHAPTSLPNLNVAFDVEVLLAVDNSTPTSAVSKAGMTFSFPYTITGWRILSDAAGTITVDVRKGAFSAFPANDTGFSVFMIGTDHFEFMFETTIEVASGETIQFVPNLDTAPVLPTSTYVSIELLCTRKLS